MKICRVLLRSFSTVASIAFFVVTLTRPVTAHDQIPGPPQTQPILIQNTTLHLGDGGVKAGTSLLFDKGKITEIGKRIQKPSGARVIDGSGKQVYPGLIDSFTDLGLREITAVDVTVDSAERGDRNPNVRSWVAVNPDSELIPVARANGILLAHVVPMGRFIRGQSAVMQLDGWSNDDMTLAAPTGLCVSWDSVVSLGKDSADDAKRYNEQIERLDTLFDEVRRYRDAVAADASRPTDVRLESLIPVVQGERSVFVYADQLATIESAIGYFSSRNIPIVLCGGADAMLCADSIREHDVPVILLGTYRLPRHRGDSPDSLYRLPADLHAAGIRFAIAGEGSGYPGGASNVRNLPYHAAVAVGHGLPAEQAIRAITGSAAEILGVSDRVGTLAVGRDATLIITDGDILETSSQVTQAFVQGRLVDLSSRHRQLFRKYEQKPLGESVE